MPSVAGYSFVPASRPEPSSTTISRKGSKAEPLAAKNDAADLTKADRNALGELVLRIEGKLDRGEIE